MDQKTVLAIALSMMVLFGYDSIFGAPKRAEMLKKSQAIVVKQDIDNPVIVFQELQKDVDKTTKSDFKVENLDLETKSFKANLTNVGGSLHNVIVGHNFAMPLADVLSISGIDSAEFRPIVHDDQKTVFVYKDSNLVITKIYSIKDNNLINVRMEITPLNSSSLDNIEFTLFNIDSERHNKNNHEESLYEYSVYANNKLHRKWNAFKFNAKEDKSEDTAIEWAGYRDHYSAFVIKPEFKTKNYGIKTVAENKLNISVKPQDIKAVVGRAEVYEFTIYTGPQDSILMKKYEKGFEKIVAFFGFWLFNSIAMAIYYTIIFLHGISKSWGLSIILISLIIYGISYPLTVKSMMSMRRMQLVQPKIKALQARFKDDPKKLNTEIMEIYKREKINPLGGCLPMLLQMPLFVTLYQVLWRSYYFQGQSFLWIKDLSLPDRLFIMPFSLPFLGNEFNILPILMGLVMFAQQKVSSKSMVVTDEQQAMQQKMMMYFFPIFIGFMFYKFASGLSLYFTVFYLLSTLTQWKMSKQGIVAAPAGMAMGHRGEKPKEK